MWVRKNERKKERQKKRKKERNLWEASISQCKNECNERFPQQCCLPLRAAGSLHPLDAKAILKDLSENELTEQGAILWDG